MVAALVEIPNRKKTLLEIWRVLKDGGLLVVGELLWDPDYLGRKTVIGWCNQTSFKLTGKHDGLLHYLLTFQKTTAEG
jgi:ubiquinone/menaquinone biosynthesis C-methylase UbiE